MAVALGERGVPGWSSRATYQRHQLVGYLCTQEAAYQCQNRLGSISSATGVHQLLGAARGQRDTRWTTSTRPGLYRALGDGVGGGGRGAAMKLQKKDFCDVKANNARHLSGLLLTFCSDCWCSFLREVVSYRISWLGDGRLPKSVPGTPSDIKW